MVHKKNDRVKRLLKQQLFIVIAITLFSIILFFITKWLISRGYYFWGESVFLLFSRFGELLTLMFIGGSSFIGIIYTEIREIRKIEEFHDSIFRFIQNPAKDIQATESDLLYLGSCIKQLYKDATRNGELLELEFQKKIDFITYLAHDIKTPLSSIIGYLSLLVEAEDIPNEQREKYIKTVFDNAKRLNKLIDEFFTITKFHLKNIPLNKQNIHLKLLLEQLLDDYLPAIKHVKKEISFKAQNEIIVKADSEKIVRAFQNLLENAINYSKEQSVIIIELVKRDGCAVICFKSEGDEIPKASADRLFEPFYRVDPARSRNTGGSGLGLSIVKEIILQHDGTINYKREDHWNVFEVEIPINSGSCIIK